MLKIRMVGIGKSGGSGIETLVEKYQLMLKRYCKFELNILPEIKTGSGDIVRQKRLEAEKFRSVIRKGDYVILLDIHGKKMSSEQFAIKLEKLGLNRSSSLVFVIGGAYGFQDEFSNDADFKMSLSGMTFSHQLVRVIFLEQLYRAFSILNNDPYHHGS